MGAVNARRDSPQRRCGELRAQLNVERQRRRNKSLHSCFWKYWVSVDVVCADDSRVLLRASKLLHDILPCQPLPHKPERFLIHQPHRPPARRVLRPTAAVVRPFARTGVSGIAGVQRAVRATDDVDGVHTPIVAGSARP